MPELAREAEEQFCIEQQTLLRHARGVLEGQVIL
jgi:hypothetical protein